MHSSRADNVHEILTCPRRRGFFVSNARSLFGNFAMADFRQISPWHVNRGWNSNFGKNTKIFNSGVICPQNPKLGRGSNRHLTQSRLQVTGCTAERYCLLRVVVQGPGSFWGRSAFCTTYGCGATGRQSCPIRILAYFPHTKCLKKYLPVTSLQPRGYITEWFDFSIW